MVQKYHSPIRVYKYPFELVMAAYERRFPSCDMIPVFEGSDIISEEKSEDGAEIIIVRRCKLNVDAPYLLKKIAGVDYFYCLQKNTLDFRNRTLKIEAWNESFANRIIIQEYCTYFVHPENQEWTCFEQSASLEVKSFFGFENAVEKLSAKHYGASIKKGKEVIEYFIEELKKDGITFIEPFKEKEPIESNGKLENNKENDDDNKEQELPPTNKLPVKQNDSIEEKKITNALNKKLSIEEKTKENNVNDKEEKKLSPNKNVNTTTDTITTQQKRDLMKKQQTSFSTEQTFPNTNPNMKLEADYIQKCIGLMTPYQESCLVQLKKRIIETHYNQGNQPTQTNMSLKKKIPSDQTMMRFLLANNYNLEKAREMLCSSLVWRKKHQVDKILSSYNLPEVVQKYYPGCWLNNHDKDGRPIYMLMVGQMDLKGFVRSIGQDGLVKLTLHVCEEGLKKAEEATKKFGKPISSWTLLLDLDGLNIRHLWRPGIKACLHIIEMVEANYPETLGRVIMTRAPRLFPVIFTLLGPFINENTARKFVFLGDQQDFKVLEQFIDMKDIPKFLNGKLDNPLQLLTGGLIPKSHYMSDEKADELNALDNTMYTNISLAKGQTHEVLYDIKDSQSVICWDFDVLKQDVIFNFYRLNSNLQNVNKSDVNETKDKEDKSHSKDNLNNNNLVKKQLSKENVNNDDKKKASSSQESLNDEQLTITEKQLQSRLSGDASSGLIIPKSWQIEPELLCREGDSIQGSHITSKPGKYVLQWKYSEPSINHHHSFSSHKAKIMYYTEVIKSKTFKGSMTSLSSLHSSHSGTNSGQMFNINQVIVTQGANGSCVGV